MAILIMGCALAFNLLIIIWKFNHNRHTDASIDLGLLILIGLFFSSSFNSLSVGTIASAIISLYLLAFPPSFGDSDE